MRAFGKELEWLTFASLSVSVHVCVVFVLLMDQRTPSFRATSRPTTNAFNVYFVPVTHPDAAGQPAEQSTRSPSSVTRQIAPVTRAALSGPLVNQGLPDTSRTLKANDVPADTSAADILKYQQLLLSHIRSFQHYPVAAQNERLEGHVDLGFSIRRNGSLIDVWLERSSGYGALDTEALATLRRASPLPPIPSALPEEMRVELPITFSLAGARLS